MEEAGVDLREGVVDLDALFELDGEVLFVLRDELGDEIGAEGLEVGQGEKDADTLLSVSSLTSQKWR